MSTNFPGSPLRWVLLHFPVLWEIDGETHAFSIWWSIQYDGNCMGKNQPYYGKSMIINFSDFPHTMCFVAFSRTVGNLWGNQYISHILKYTIGWKSEGKKAPILWEKYDYWFPKRSPYHGFSCIFPHCGEFVGKPIHFPQAEVYHRIGIGGERRTHTMGKIWLSISQTFPIPWVLLHFPVLWIIYGETHALPIWWDRLIFSSVGLSIFTEIILTFPLYPFNAPASSCHALRNTKIM